MRLNSFRDLSFVIRRVRQIIKDRRSKEIEDVYQELHAGLKVYKDDIATFGSLTICSKYYSYHVLSTYLLLDMIDLFWDGIHFSQKEDSENYFLLEELSQKDEAPTANIDIFFDYLEKLAPVANETLLIFLMPYDNEKTWVLKEGQQGDILILYAGGEEALKKAFVEGVCTFYIKKELKNKLPKWANSESEFKEELKKWFEDSESKFKSN